jgi:hypothetical protein
LAIETDVCEREREREEGGGESEANAVKFLFFVYNSFSLLLLLSALFSSHCTLNLPPLSNGLLASL